jgi:hypothetical protein
MQVVWREDMSHAFCVSKAQCDAMADIVKSLVVGEGQQQQQQAELQPSLEDAVQAKQYDATVVLDALDQEEGKVAWTAAYQPDTREAQDANIVPVGAY